VDYFCPSLFNEVTVSNKQSLEILKSLNAIQLWVFILLRSICNPLGFVKKEGSLGYIAKMLGSLTMDDGKVVEVRPSSVKARVGELAYLGVLKFDPNVPANHIGKTRQCLWPLRIEKDFMNFLPTKYRNPEIVEEIEGWKAKLKRSDDLKKEANDTIRRLRGEIRISKSSFTPDFKLYKNDGTINKRSVEFQRLWAWFVLLDIQQAFEKATPPKRPQEIDLFSDESAKIQPDYATMSVWISTYGLDAIEALLHNFYMNNRLKDLKIDAGDRWPQAVLRFIYGALKKSSAKTNKKENEREFSEEKYEPRGGWPKS